MMKQGKLGLRNLRAYRHAAGLSIRRLAQKAGTTYMTINRCEHGKSDPALKTIRKLARALKVTGADLMEPGRGPKTKSGQGGKDHGQD